MTPRLSRSLNRGFVGGGQIVPVHLPLPPVELGRGSPLLAHLSGGSVGDAKPSCLDRARWRRREMRIRRAATRRPAHGCPCKANRRKGERLWSAAS